MLLTLCVHGKGSSWSDMYHAAAVLLIMLVGGTGPWRSQWSFMNLLQRRLFAKTRASLSTPSTCDEYYTLPPPSLLQVRRVMAAQLLARMQPMCAATPTTCAKVVTARARQVPAVTTLCPGQPAVTTVDGGVCCLCQVPQWVTWELWLTPHPQTYSSHAVVGAPAGLCCSDCAHWTQIGVCPMLRDSVQHSHYRATHRSMLTE